MSDSDRWVENENHYFAISLYFEMCRVRTTHISPGGREVDGGTVTFVDERRDQDGWNRAVTADQLKTLVSLCPKDSECMKAERTNFGPKKFLMFLHAEAGLSTHVVISESCDRLVWEASRETDDPVFDVVCDMGSLTLTKKNAAALQQWISDIEKKLNQPPEPTTAAVTISACAAATAVQNR